MLHLYKNSSRKSSLLAAVHSIHLMAVSQSSTAQDSSTWCDIKTEVRAALPCCGRRPVHRSPWASVGRRRGGCTADGHDGRVVSPRLRRPQRDCEVSFVCARQDPLPVGHAGIDTPSDSPSYTADVAIIRHRLYTSAPAHYVISIFSRTTQSRIRGVRMRIFCMSTVNVKCCAQSLRRLCFVCDSSQDVELIKWWTR